MVSGLGDRLGSSGFSSVPVSSRMRVPLGGPDPWMHVLAGLNLSRVAPFPNPTPVAVTWGWTKVP